MTDKFTDAAIISLAKCRRLETVNLDWCNDITTIVPIAENCPLKKLVLDCKMLTYDCRLWYPGEGRHELVRLLHEHLPNPEQSHPRIMEMLPALTPRGQH